MPAGKRYALLSVLVGIGEQIGSAKHESRTLLKSNNEVLVHAGQFCSTALKAQSSTRRYVSCPRGEKVPYSRKKD